MAFAFKKFTFFQQSDVAHHGCPINASCHAFGHHKILVGCANGTLHILNESYQPVAVFTAYGHKVLHVAWAEVGATSRTDDADTSASAVSSY
jgi:hypothetical protein